MLRRLRGLGEEEPVPPRGGEARVTALEVLDDREPVRDCERGDRVGMVERRVEGDERAAVVAEQRELIVAELRHQRDHVAGHRALGVRRVVGSRRRLGGLAVAAQVRAHDRVGGREHRRHPVPGRVRAGMAVQQHERRAGAAVAHAQLRIADVDPLEREAFEHLGG